MRTFHNIITILIVAIALQSCSWFDVGSQSEVDEDEMYRTADGFYTTLTGIYDNLGSTTLYGGNLPLYALEPLTQQYSVSSDNPDRTAWAQFNYTTDAGQTLITNIWQTMYNTIVNDNLLISRLNTNPPAGLENGVTEIMQGEAIAMRALMYFDLIRLWNDSYTVNPDSKNVPYKTDFGFSLGAQATTTQILDTLVNDLLTARRLLQDDPMKTGGSFSNKYVSYNRTERMNYYAATALLARIELYRKHYAEAAQYALEVINSGKFRFIKADETVQTDAYGAEIKADRIFMPEMIFALYNENILTTSRSYYEGLTQDFVKSTNAYTDGDIRSVWFFANPSANNKINLIRYQRSTNQADASRYGDPVTPMLKLSEMYLIAAECGLEDSGTGIDSRAMLNTMRTARGEAEIGETATPQQLRTEITHEYICDFKGEGQLFYYYKRMNMAAVDDGYANGNTVSIPQKAYTLPLPEYEQQFGYGQH